MRQVTRLYVVVSRHYLEVQWGYAVRRRILRSVLLLRLLEVVLHGTIHARRVTGQLHIGRQAGAVGRLHVILEAGTVWWLHAVLYAGL